MSDYQTSEVFCSVPLRSIHSSFSLIVFGCLILGTEVAFFSCVKGTNAATAAVLASNRPFFIMLLLCFLGSKPTIKQFLCSVMAVTGIALLVTKGNFSSLSFNAVETLVGLGAPLFSACYTLQSRNLIERFDPVVVMAWAMTIATILANGYVPFWSVRLEWTTLSILAILCVSVVGHILAYLCYLLSACKINPTVTGVLETVEPLTTVILSYLLFKIALDRAMVGGAILILLAVSILGLTRHRKSAIDASAMNSKH
ncbi:MAG: DMT family transporter [Turicimonas muris]